MSATAIGHEVCVFPDALTGQVHRDHTVLTGDSPFASNGLVKLTAQTLPKAGLK